MQIFERVRRKVRTARDTMVGYERRIGALRSPKRAPRTGKGKVERDREIRVRRKQLREDPQDAFPGTGHQKPLEEENRQLRRELQIAQEERDILKKVVAIFSRPKR